MIGTVHSISYSEAIVVEEKAGVACAYIAHAPVPFAQSGFLRSIQFT